MFGIVRVICKLILYIAINLILDITYTWSPCVYSESPYLEHVLVATTHRNRRGGCRLSILTPATGRCFLRCFATRYAPKMVHVSTPMTPGFNHEKWGNQGTNPRHFVNRSWKKWWFRRRFAFLSGIAYMILGAMKFCTVFFCFGRIKICDGLSQVHLISWTRRRNWKNPMVGGFSSQLF